MYICLQCGETFEHEEIHWAIERHGEETCSCPHCRRGDFEEAQYCKICGEPFIKDDLSEGYCEECLLQQITFDNFRQFSLEDCKDCEVSIFEEFMFKYCYGIDYFEHPTGSSRALKDLLIKDYIERSRNDDKHIMLESIRKYTKGYWSEFAKYVAVKEVKQCTKDEIEPSA